MYCTSPLIKRRPFMMVEILIAMSLIALFVPSLIHEQTLARKEIERQEFLNLFENRLKEHLFYLYYNLNQEKYQKSVLTTIQTPYVIAYDDLIVNDHAYATFVTIEHLIHDPKSDYYELSLSLEVINLPHGVDRFKTNTQNYYLKKTSSAM